jgi:rhodanese-related sulfurtransferase
MTNDALDPHSIDDRWERTPLQVKAMLAADDPPLLIDCRTSDEHASCRIDGCTLVPLQELSLRIDELRDHAADPVIVYCRSGRRSLSAAQFMKSEGFTSVWSMAGGINQWANDVDPSIDPY